MLLAIIEMRGYAESAKEYDAEGGEKNVSSRMIELIGRIRLANHTEDQDGEWRGR